MSELENFIQARRFCRDKAHNSESTLKALGRCTCANLITVDDLREFVTQLESANSALRDEAKRHSEFMKGKTLVDDEMREDALRYQWLRTRAGQIGAFLWRRAPWIHEDYAENQARFDLCVDEERAEVLDRLAKEALQQSTPTPLEQSEGKV